MTNHELMLAEREVAERKKLETLKGRRKRRSDRNRLARAIARRKPSLGNWNPKGQPDPKFLFYFPWIRIAAKSRRGVSYEHLEKSGVPEVRRWSRRGAGK